MQLGIPPLVSVFRKPVSFRVIYALVIFSPYCSATHQLLVLSWFCVFITFLVQLVGWVGAEITTLPMSESQGQASPWCLSFPEALLPFSTFSCNVLALGMSSSCRGRRLSYCKGWAHCITFPDTSAVQKRIQRRLPGEQVQRWFFRHCHCPM